MNSNGARIGSALLLLALAVVVVGRLGDVRAANREPAQSLSAAADGCSATRATARLKGLVAAFNAGDGARFAQGFATRGASFQAYGLRRGIAGRRAIARFVTARGRHGDRWLIKSIRGSSIDRYYGPTRGRIYTLFLDVRGRSKKVIKGGAATASILCSTGLVLHWIGPARAPS